ncbi:MAG: hypothetical protein JWQ71_3883 [Pedosphaera sp.]|nr:hypothetical protein [Pedosphaera sp.]
MNKEGLILVSDCRLYFDHDELQKAFFMSPLVEFDAPDRVVVSVFF